MNSQDDSHIFCTKYETVEEYKYVSRVTIELFEEIQIELNRLIRKDREEKE